jgi:6-phosphogluconolactonase (cycloisomerase 2 family)
MRAAHRVADLRIVALLVIAVALPLAAARSAAAQLTFVQEEGRDEYAGITDVVLSPDGRFVYVTDYVGFKITAFARDLSTGAIEEAFEFFPGAAFVTNLVISSDGAYLYAVAYYSGTLIVMRRDQASGALTVIQTLDAGASLARAQGMALSGDGAFLYVTGVDSDSIVVCARDAGTGLLSFVEVQVNGAGGVSGLESPVGVAVSADGTSVYVAGDAGTLVAFGRDPATGRLTFVEAHYDGVGGERLRFAFAVAVSPDAAHVYVSTIGGASVYARDPTTGALTLVQLVNEGVDHDIWITADGSRAYGCGSTGTLVGFARDPVSGQLTADERRFAGAGGISAPGFCFGMTITPDGQYLYTIDSYNSQRPGVLYEYGIGVFRHLHVQCSAAPRPDCAPARPRGSVLSLTHRGRPERDKLVWKWRGDAVAVVDFGAPDVHATDYALCVYDATGGVVDVAAPAAVQCRDERLCWRKRDSGFVYTDPDATHDGVKRVGLAVSKSAQGKVKLVGKGLLLALPGHALSGSVRAQLQASDGSASRCWEARFTQPGDNDPQRYHARSD